MRATRVSKPEICKHNKVFSHYVFWKTRKAACVKGKTSENASKERPQRIINAQIPRPSVVKTTYSLQNTRTGSPRPKDTHIAGSEDLLEQSVEVLLLRAQVSFVLGLKTELPVLHNFRIKVPICKREVKNPLSLHQLLVENLSPKPHRSLLH